MRRAIILGIWLLAMGACAPHHDDYAASKHELLNRQPIFQNSTFGGPIRSEIHMKAAANDPCSQAINPLLDQASAGGEGLSLANAAALASLAAAAASSSAPSAAVSGAATSSPTGGGSSAAPPQDSTSGSGTNLAGGPGSTHGPALPFDGQNPSETSPPGDQVGGSATASPGTPRPGTGSGSGHPATGPGGAPPDTVAGGLGSAQPPKDIVTPSVAAKEQVNREGLTLAVASVDGLSSSSSSNSYASGAFPHPAQRVQSVARGLASTVAPGSVGQANGPGLFRILSTTYDHLCQSDRLKYCRRFALQGK